MLKEEVILPDYIVRPMLWEEIPQVLQLWKEAGIGEGTHALDTWFKFDPNGFYVAVAEDGTLLGACAGILQEKELAFIGLYVVKSTYQRKGIGMKIWNTVMERVGHRNVGVNPVPEQLENYRAKSNFPIQTSWFSVIRRTPAVDVSQLHSDAPSVHVQPLVGDNSYLMQQVVTYDADVVGFCRNNLIPILSVQEDCITLVATNVGNGEVCGYGSIQMNIKGNAIVGPLYADNREVAEKLLHELVVAFPVAQTQGVTLFLIDTNQDGMDLAHKLGTTKTFCVARLYRKKEIDVKFEKVYSQFNLNFAII